ncbi:UNVERIFIED_CONTAM: hypothetical protein GTU68_030607 [Idotea baltica]|nr:hypothetical protein [Idotea baltica]
MGILNTYKKLEENINTPTIYDLSPYEELVDSIDETYQNIKDFDDNELKQFHNSLKSNFSENSDDEQRVIAGFALIKVLANRLLGLEAFDVQIIAGLVIYEGRIAEMKTGEGKTLAALFPTYLRAIEGKGVHVHTFNDYLSKRDYNNFLPVFDFLDISSASLIAGMNSDEVKNGLNADVTYGSAKQFIYNYLKFSISEDFNYDFTSKFHYAIIDEADAILLDEATNPFVIAGNNNGYNEDFHKIAKAVKLAVKAELFEYTDFKRGVFLSEDGTVFLEKTLNINNLYSEECVNILAAINLSLHAHLLLEKDKDYIIRNDEILLVDEFTGRVVTDRKWRNGLQTAVEAKEGLHIKSEGNILNSISISNFYKEYRLISAMTATAVESSNEIDKSYGLVLVVIPPNLPSQRIDHKTRVFRTKKLKYEAIVEKIIDISRSGKPVLIGTQHISESELIYNKLLLRGVNAEILNAKNDELEAGIIAKAGMLHAITISTNMAGRGTDIKLGGEEGIHKNKIEKLGGLFVIGTNMHRSGRIDRQLKGRAGRQGEMGESQLFVSLKDELFDKNKMEKILAKKFRVTEDDEIVDPDIHKYIKHTQEVSEDQDNIMRDMINQYSEITHYQSQLIGQKRKDINAQDKDRKLKEAQIASIDKLWSIIITQLYEIKDGVHVIKLGGQNPLRAYRIIADNLFKELLVEIQESLDQLEKSYLENSQAFTKQIENQRPSSTWTYTVSDKGFTTSLESMIMGSSNIGLQVDLLGLTVLFFKYSWKKILKLMKNKNSYK